jgi:uncharacterized protein YprB with RNaseH-like and TPR domain
MPSLSDKLKSLGVEVGTSNIPKPTRESSRQLLVDVFDGSWEETRSGDCFVVRKTYSFTKKHGNRKLYNPINLDLFSFLPGLENISSVSPENILYIDTETTGLSGGAGTYVFLIGAARINGNSFELAQFFLQDPANEPSQLSALDQFVNGIELIVSYNGKSFDLPRIRTRYLNHGWQTPFNKIMHIDLLHLGRRLWKDHLPGCSLGDLEFHILDIKRSSLDIPGWQVSEKFFEYLQTGDPAPLKNILYHNEIDVISLISLFSYISDRLSNPTAAKYKENQDLISIGKILAEVDENLAIEVIQKSLENPDLKTIYELAGKFILAKIYKKNTNFELAVPLWKDCANLEEPQSYIELAKYYEHKEANFEEAIHWTLSALDLYKNNNTYRKLFKEDAEYRLARLIRKQKQAL